MIVGIILTSCKGINRRLTTSKCSYIHSSNVRCKGLTFHSNSRKMTFFLLCRSIVTSVAGREAASPVMNLDIGKIIVTTAALL